MNDASCYEAQSQQQLVDDLSMTGEDMLTIDECLELLHLAQKYSAAELKKKYSVLCALKLDSKSSLRVFESGVKSEDLELALLALQLVRERLSFIIDNEREHYLELLPNIITAMLELTCDKIRNVKQIGQQITL